MTHDSTKSTFLRMLEDEEGHLKQLQTQWDRLVANDERVLNAPVFLDFDFDSLKQIFPGKDQIKARLKENLTAAEALQIAMKMEKDAYDFFHDYAEKFEDTQGKEIFLKFAEEEWNTSPRSARNSTPCPDNPGPKPSRHSTINRRRRLADAMPTGG